MPLNLDTGIPLSARTFSGNPFLEAFAGAQQIAMQRESARAIGDQRAALAEQRKAQAAAAQRDAEREAKLTELFTNNPKPTRADIMRADPTENGSKIATAIEALQDTELKRFKDQTAVTKEAISGILALPENMRPGGYEAVRTSFLQRGWATPEQIPEQYNPEFVAGIQRQLLSPEKQYDIANPKLTERDPTKDLINPQTGAVVTAGTPKGPDAGTVADWLDTVAQGRGLKNGRQLDPRTKATAIREYEALKRAPESDNQPLVAIMGADGQPVLVPRSQAVGKRPASNREQGRPLPAAQADDISSFDTSLDDLKVLRTTISESGATGTAAKIGASVPNVVTDLTGWGTEAKTKQATIDRVKQVIGKTLEGGVLRKEDEAKYERILPTIADTPAVVKAKLDGLDAAIQRRRNRYIDAMEDANYDVSKYRTRGAAPTDKPKADPLGIR